MDDPLSTSLPSNHDDFTCEIDEDDYTILWPSGEWLTAMRNGKITVGISPRENTFPRQITIGDLRGVNSNTVEKELLALERLLRDRKSYLEAAPVTAAISLISDLKKAMAAVHTCINSKQYSKAAFISRPSITSEEMQKPDQNILTI